MRLATRLVAALVVATTAQASSVAHVRGEGAPLGFTLPFKVNAEMGSTPRTYTPAAVLIDPGNSMHMYAATVELRSRRCGFSRSRDGGRTWSAATSPSPASYPLCSHTVPFMPMGALAVGRTGTIYYLHRAWSHQDDGAVPNSSVFVARSEDGGDTWSTTAVRDARGGEAPDNEINFPTDIAVDTRGAADIVYVSWTTTYPTALPKRPPKPTLSVSSDGGQSFAAPIDITGSFFESPANLGGDIPEPLRRKEHFGGAIPYLALDDRGVLAVSWVRRTANVDPAEGHPRYLSRSHDRGRTFTVTQMAPASPLSNAGAVLEWSAGGGSAGTLHSVYEDKIGALQGDRDVHYRRSTDDGRTWSEPTVLNDDDPTQLFSQFLPAIVAAPNGRLDVTWWDSRRAAGQYGNDVYYTHSDDAGRSWSANAALSDRSVDRSFGSWVDNFGNARQAAAVASSEATTVVLWDDTRLGTATSPVQDLYSAVVQYEPLRRSRGSSAPAYAVSAATGLFTGALLIGVIRRRHFSRRRKVVSR